MNLARKQAGLQRSIQFYKTLQNMLHYWHVIHLPFTVVMFLVMIVHAGWPCYLAIGGYFNMKWDVFWACVYCCLLFPCCAFAQLSPGVLSRHHGAVEGLAKCTQCHQLGQHIDGKKCLDCHVQIRDRHHAQKGFHDAVKDSTCVNCHSDHTGKRFKLIRWPDETMANFDHVSTGYMLEGKKHREAECRDCHREKNIRAKDILEKRKTFMDHTFLGLDQTCSSCHTDIHRGHFDQTCDRCHDMDQWPIAGKFSHDQARYTLMGKHVSVPCRKCHTVELETENTLEGFTRFRPLDFGSCAACHENGHKKRFAEPCQTCHSPTG
jgi:predicted CXXCH cytochrome family protein